MLDEHGILFISDEVQTGWGRTGEHFWGIGAHGVTPDAMTFAKGLGNGFAIGGVVARGDLLDGLRGNGVSTFGGNPVSTTAANATLDYLLSHDLQRNAAELGRIIIPGLRERRGRMRRRRRGTRQGPDVRRRPGRPGHRRSPARRSPRGCWRRPARAACSSARAACTATRCGWRRR